MRTVLEAQLGYRHRESNAAGAHSVLWRSSILWHSKEMVQETETYPASKRAVEMAKSSLLANP